MLKESIGAEVFDIDIDQSTAAAINGKVAHLLQVVRHLIEITVIVHVDGAPHERLVLADVAPSPSERSPNLDSSQSRQYQNGDVLWKFQPVPRFASGGSGFGFKIKAEDFLVPSLAHQVFLLFWLLVKFSWSRILSSRNLSFFPSLLFKRLRLRKITTRLVLNFLYRK